MTDIVVIKQLRLDRAEQLTGKVKRLKQERFDGKVSPEEFTRKLPDILEELIDSIKH